MAASAESKTYSEPFQTMIDLLVRLKKQHSSGVLSKKRSENMQQIYRTTTMPKCDLYKVT